MDACAQHGTLAGFAAFWLRWTAALSGLTDTARIAASRHARRLQVSPEQAQLAKRPSHCRWRQAFIVEQARYPAPPSAPACAVGRSREALHVALRLSLVPASLLPN